MKIPFRIVDVFTERPLAGNQLCVVPEPRELDDATMQALAIEIGFSESTFVTEAGGDRYAMRIFTPDRELPFAGHPTLGTGFVLVSEGRVTSPATQVVRAGEIPVEVDAEAGFAWMTQLAPEFGAEFDDVDLLARATGLLPEDMHPDLPAQVVSTGLPPLIVPVRDLATLFAVHDGGVTARFFGPTESIREDAATGSAAGPLGAYLAERGLAGMPGTVVIAQGEQIGRPSFLHVEVTRQGTGWRVRVGGGVRVIGSGTFRI
ncbi:MAG: PhzF family phenazine biosynthesis protein [Actinomycetota bacterium]